MTIGEFIKDRNNQLSKLILLFQSKLKPKLKTPTDPFLKVVDQISKLSPEDLKLLEAEIMKVELTLTLETPK